MTQPVSSISRRPWLRWAALAAVVLVPLAFAGLFIGAVSNVKQGISDIPAAIVNNDVAATQTGTDGKVTNVLAGRELVTELTGAKSAGFDWTITNSKDAKADLANGTVYAILTVPKDFSKSIVSLSSKNPVKANLAITTDDSHNYLTGSVAQIVGSSLSSAFGQAITKQYIAGIYSGIAGVGTSLQSAADGASKLSGGASSLSKGLDSYVTGVSAVPSGLRQLQSGILTAKTGTIGGVKTYVNQVNLETKKLEADMASGDTAAVQVDVGTLDAMTSKSAQSQLGSKLGTGFDKLASSTGSFAAKTVPLISGGKQLASGASSLSSGASSLASGLQKGADSSPSYSKAEVSNISSVVSDPVGVTVDRKHKVSSPAQIIATLFVPLGLWIGSLAVFLVMRPLTRRTLSSTAGNGRLVLSSIARASIVTGAQALLLVLLLHTAVGVSWALLPATILFSLVMAIAFTAFHYLLTIGLGRGGLIVSIFLLAIQITSTGGLYPIQLLAKPFQFISPILPLTYGVRGMEAIIANSGVGVATGSAVVLVVFGGLSVLVALLAVRRVRRAGALGLVPATA